MMINEIAMRVEILDLIYSYSCFFGIFIISLVLIPQIRSLVLKFNLKDTPEYRSSHTIPVPTFGGIIFYISYIVVLFFSQSLYPNSVIVIFLISVSVIFLTGLLDDLKSLSPKTKFLGQSISVAILMIEQDLRIVSLHGFMGINEIPLFISISGSMFFLLGLINGFNLIDGIDGLMGITGVIVASFYCFMFYQLGYFFYLSLSLATIATLLAFLRYNFSRSRKIFMGDTGSLVIGLVLGLLTMQLMSHGEDISKSFSFKGDQLPLLLIAVLFVPLLDTLRVMFLRLTRGVSMFKPDRNHIHHIMVDYGYSHGKASFFIGFTNFVVALIMFFVVQKFNTIESFLILLVILFTIILILFLMNKNIKAIKLKVKIRKSVLRIFSLL